MGEGVCTHVWVQCASPCVCMFATSLSEQRVPSECGGGVVEGVHVCARACAHLGVHVMHI